MITLSINGRTINVLSQSTILQACKSRGINIPHFCYHENLSVAGNCRICLVEVYKAPKPVVSCARPVSKGRIIFTETPLVRKARESILEFLLLNHPLDCPICDQGSECDLQDETRLYASDRSRFFIFKKTREDKPCGPIIKTIITRCIHCTRCVRFCTEVAGTTVRGNFGRGEESEIGTYIHSFMKTELSGNLVDVCPVGALTSKPYSFKARQWDLQQKNNIDFFDTRLSDLIINTTASNSHYANKLNFKSKIRRILPNINSKYAENWISDRTRYAFDSLNTRFTVTEASQFNLLKPFVNKLNSQGNTSNSVIFNSHTNLERLHFIINFYKYQSTNAIQFSQTNFHSKLNIDLPFFYTLNQKVSQFISQKINIILRIGSNLRYEASLLNTRRRRKQRQQNITLRTIAAFTVLNYSQNHQGNTNKTLIALKENRLSIVKKEIKKDDGIGVLFGATTTKHKYSNFRQQITLCLSKYFFIKTKQQSRFGMIHNSVGSLAFSHRGFKTKILNNKKFSWNYQINVGLETTTKSFIKNFFNKNKKFIFNFDTHCLETDPKTKINYPITSLYERSGTLISIDNQIHTHNKIINVNEEQIQNIETYYRYWIAKNIDYTFLYVITKKRAQFKNRTRIKNKNKTNNICFIFNPFNIHFSSFGKHILFRQSTHNFYLDAPLANTSPTRAACSLFLNQENNFTTEI